MEPTKSDGAGRGAESGNDAAREAARRPARRPRRRARVLRAGRELSRAARRPLRQLRSASITCRHEAGAANMAEAYGKLTGRPGICLVTRGPGATQASVGVHTAFQDSTPLILFVGQVASDQEEREAFQEIDYRRMFGPMAKWVGADRPRRAHPRARRARVRDGVCRPPRAGRARAAGGHAAAGDRRAATRAVPRRAAEPGRRPIERAARSLLDGRAAAARDRRRRAAGRAAATRDLQDVPRGERAPRRRGVPPPGLARQRLTDLRRRRRHRHQPEARRARAARPTCCSSSGRGSAR